MQNPFIESKSETGALFRIKPVICSQTNGLMRVCLDRFNRFQKCHNFCLRSNFIKFRIVPVNGVKGIAFHDFFEHFLKSIRFSKTFDTCHIPVNLKNSSDLQI